MIRHIYVQSWSSIISVISTSLQGTIFEIIKHAIRSTFIRDRMYFSYLFLLQCLTLPFYICICFTDNFPLLTIIIFHLTEINKRTHRISQNFFITLILSYILGSIFDHFRREQCILSFAICCHPTFHIQVNTLTFFRKLHFPAKSGIFI